MKNLIRTSTGDLERSPNPLTHCREYDPRQVHDHQHGQSPQSFCFAAKSEHPSPLDHQHRLFPCGNGPPMLPMAARSFSCSQLTGLVDYPSDAMKQQQTHHHCKSEKHDEDSPHLSAKCQMHSSNTPDATAGILVKTEFNEMQPSKSSPVHEVFEMTSRAFASPVPGSGGSAGSSTSQFHHETGSPPLPLAETANPSSAAAHHLQHQPHHHHHHHHQHQQCSANAYESYVYASGSRVGMSPRQIPGAMNATAASGSEISGGLYHCKSFFSDSGSGSGGSGIAAFYPNSQPSNGESCRDDSSGFPRRDALDADDKVAISIKSRKISD